MRRPRRERRGAATDTEWLWLAAAPGHNPFVGLGPGAPGQPTMGHLAELWREYRGEILALWRENPPEELPYDHPAESEMPPELRAWNEPDPRRLQGRADPKAWQDYDDRLAAWRERRAAWFRRVEQ